MSHEMSIRRGTPSEAEARTRLSRAKGPGILLLVPEPVEFAVFERVVFEEVARHPKFAPGKKVGALERRRATPATNRLEPGR